MNVRVGWLMALAGAWSLGGCSSDESSDPDWLQFAQAQAAVECEGALDVDVCRVSVADRVLNRFVPAAEAGARAGRLKLGSQAELLACARARARVVESTSTACQRAVRGQVPRGGECYIFAECVPGDYCGGATCPGTCQEPPGQGQACASRDGCAGEYECFDSKCVALKAEGETCEISGQRSTCGMPNLACVTQEDGERICVNVAQEEPTQTVGEPCMGAAGQDCKVGLACDYGGPDSEVGRCVAVLAAGSACSNSTSSSAPCPLNQYCNGTVCADLLAYGETCSTAGSCWSLTCDGTCEGFYNCGPL